MQKKAGFLIFEVLVALVILSLGFVASFRAFGGVLEILQRTGQHFYATIEGEQISLELSAASHEKTLLRPKLFRDEFNTAIRSTPLNFTIDGFSVVKNHVQVIRNEERLLHFPLIQFYEVEEILSGE